ncbi:hypothetical protein D9M71_464990 [compost metagenome]
MTDIQAAVGGQVAEGLVRQLQAILDDSGDLGRQGDAGAFQHVDHAEEAHRVVASDAVVDVADHQLGRQVGRGVAHRLGIGATGADVVEDPLLVAVLLLDVLGDRAAQPLQPLRQARPAGHQQRHGVLDVVVGLTEEGHVAVEADPPGQDLGEDRCSQQVFALGLGLFLQGLVETHQYASSKCSVRPSGCRWRSGNAATGRRGAAGRWPWPGRWPR